MAQVTLTTLGRNTIVAALAEIWRILSRFILTPLIIGKLGVDGYGAWTLVFSVAAYVSMANASFGLAYTKFTAECMQSEQYDRLAKIIGSGIVGIGSVAVLGLLGAILFGDAIMGALLHKTPHLATDAADALNIVMVALVLRMTIGCCHEVLSGLQRMDLTSKLTVYGSIFEFVISVPLLYLGYGMKGLAIGHVVGYGVTNFMAYALVRKYAPQLRISPFAMSREGMQLMVVVGGKFQGLMVINTVAVHGGKFIITALLGATWTGVYTVAERLMELGKAASAAVVGPLMPAFADAQARKDTAQERLLFLKGSKADGLAGGGALAFLAIFAPQVVFIWTGEHMPDAAWALQVMAFGDALFVLSSVVSSSLRARGQVRLEMTTALLSSGIGFSLIFPLASLYAFAGVVVARLIAQCVAAPWYLFAYLRQEHMSLRSYLSETRLSTTAVVVFIAMVVSWTGSTLLPMPSFGLRDRWHAVVNVLVWATPFALIWAVGAWRWVLDEIERASLREFGVKVRRRLGLR